jgi:hypothetical protein
VPKRHTQMGDHFGRFVTGRFVCTRDGFPSENNVFSAPVTTYVPSVIYSAIWEG